MVEWSFPPPESRRSPALAREGSDVLLVRWDPIVGVAFISHPWGLVLALPEEMAHWSVELFEKLGIIEKQRGGRFPIVVCVDGLTIRPSAAEEYGRIVRRYAERYASGIARYSQRPNGVGQIITVAAMKEGFRANLFSSRSDAVAQALAGDGSASSKVRPGT
jgi:hypothetical protein